MPLERSGDKPSLLFTNSLRVIEPMGPLLLWIEQNVHKRLSLSVIARHAAMSTRTLTRRFRERVALRLVQWIARARVRRAQQLLETTSLSIEQIATEAGFRSASVLREHFGGIPRNHAAGRSSTFGSDTSGATGISGGRRVISSTKRSTGVPTVAAWGRIE